jgi:hypothetical protein
MKAPGPVHRISSFPPLAAIIFISFVLLAACSAALTPLGSPREEGRDDENFQDFMDIPFPSIMAVEKGNVVVFTRRGVLSGYIPLMGALSIDELLDYYDRHLPGHGWAPHSEVQTERGAVSTWIKSGKTLSLVLTQPKLSIGVNATLQIWVAPPHTKDDLGNRVIYRDTNRPGRTFNTTPIRSGSGGFGGSGSDVSEEDL